MIKIKNFIAQIVRNKNLKWVLVFLIVGGLFVGRSYAVDTGMTTLDTIGWIGSLLLSLVSWLWIILANLAGKLMTNDLLYGSFLHLDASLWTLRNIMKNFANFALGFMVIYAVVRNIFSIGDDSSDERSPKKVITKTLIAGILIQMSWFLMGAVVDLSTIMTSAVGSFPSQFIASDNEFRGKITNNIGNIKRGTIVFNSEDPENLLEWEPDESVDMNEDEVNRLIDMLMPSHASVSGPLLFIGMSVFDFNDFDKYTNKKADKWSEVLLSLSFSAIVIIAFSVMMLFIFIFNLFRIMMLWIIIPLLPMIALLHVFGFVDKLKGGEGGMDLSKFLDIKNILMLIFKPVLMVGTLSLILVILVLIKNVISPNKVGTVQLMDQGNITIESVKDGDDGLYESSLKADGIMEFSMSGMKDTIADLIVYFFGLFLIYFLVKMVVKIDTGIGFIDNTMNGMFDFAEGAMSNLPIIPIGGGVGFSAIKDGADIGGAATRLMGIDSAAHDARVADLLGTGEDYSSLGTGSDTTKETFIKQSLVIMEKNDWDTQTLYGKKDYTNKLKEWENNNTDDGKISEIDLKAARKK